MSKLARTIQDTEVRDGSLAIFWLAQAGFIFKTSMGQVVYVDPYFSDAGERLYGLKRMMACPMSPDEVDADLIVCTHEHLDHLDLDALPALSKNVRTRFAGPIECVKEFRKAGIPEERLHLLDTVTQLNIEGLKILGVYADHGDLAPDALGIVLDFSGIKVYHTGDTAYRPEEFRPAIDLGLDVVIPCINGRYGNLDAREAALLVGNAKPQLAIASHFWMFVEHNGDPALFLEHCSRLAPAVQSIVMKPGELHMFKKSAKDAVAGSC